MSGVVTPFPHIPSRCSQELNLYLMSLMTMIVWPCCMNSKYSVGPCIVQMWHICMLMAYRGIIFKHQ